MKKILSIFLSVHLVLFASFYYVQKFTCNTEADNTVTVTYSPDKALVLAGRFENMLNHLSGISTHHVENYTLNEDGTYTVFTKVDTEKGEQQAVSLFAPDEQSNFGYELIYCNVMDLSSLSSM